ncbi:MAG: APC family permease [Sulfobacillus thermotolerans]|nr:APC family permease [Sulfobacillus thermotolerans]
MAENRALGQDVGRLQPPQQLAKDLGWLAVIGLGITSEVGAGIFYLTAQVQAEVPGIGPHVPLALIVDALLATVLALTYWFFSHSIAGAGGEYLFVSRSLGPQAGFIVHVVSWFGATASMGFLAYTAPSFLSAAMMPIASGLGTWLATPMGTVVAGLIMIWGAWAIHARGVKHVGTLVKVATAVIAVAASTVIVVGFSHGPSTLAQKLAEHDHLSFAFLNAHAGSSPHWAAFLEALPILYFAYAGLRSTTYAGGEVRQARKVVSGSVLVVLGLVAILYVTFALALYHMAPWSVIAGLIATGHKSLANASALTGLFLPAWAAILLSFAVAAIVFKTILPGMMGQSRMLLAFAEDGLVPQGLKHLSSKKTPVRALTVGAALASVVLIQTGLTGTPFGVAASVLAGAIVHAALGLGLIMMPRMAPGLFAANQSWLAGRPGLRVALGTLMILIGGGMGVLVVIPEIANPWYDNPLFEVALFAVIGIALYRNYWQNVQRTQSEQAHRSKFFPAPQELEAVQQDA